MPFVNQEDARRLRQTALRVDQLPPEEWGQDQTGEGAPGPPAATLDVFEYVRTTGAALASGVAPGLVTLWDEATQAFVDRADVTCWIQPGAVQSARAVGEHDEAGDRRGLYLTAATGTTSTGYWRFSTTTTMADPGAGKLRFDNATIASAANLAISVTTDHGTDATRVLASLVIGDS